MNRATMTDMQIYVFYIGWAFSINLMGRWSACQVLDYTGPSSSADLPTNVFG